MKSAIRLTPQTKAVIDQVKSCGHCTNLQIHEAVSRQFVGISPTTIHRITNRLIDRGLLACGPKLNGVYLIDSNLGAHDHFVCNDCGGVKDVVIGHKIRLEIEQQTKTGPLLSSMIIYGDCRRCR